MRPDASRSHLQLNGVSQSSDAPDLLFPLSHAHVPIFGLILAFTFAMCEPAQAGRVMKIAPRRYEQPTPIAPETGVPAPGTPSGLSPTPRNPSDPIIVAPSSSDDFVPPSSVIDDPAVPKPQLRGLIGAPHARSEQPGGVDSFFQCAPMESPESSAPKRINGASVEDPLANKIQSSGSSSDGGGRLLWHVLDNVGIPVPYKNKDASLAPGIRRSYSNPPIPDINTYPEGETKKRKRKHALTVSPTQNEIRQAQDKAGTGTGTNTSTGTSTSAGAGARTSVVNIQQKIPASELEGTEVLTKPDDQK